MVVARGDGWGLRAKAYPVAGGLFGDAIALLVEAQQAIGQAVMLRLAFRDERVFSLVLKTLFLCELALLCFARLVSATLLISCTAFFGQTFFLGAALLLSHVSLAGGALLFSEAAGLLSAFGFLAFFDSTLLGDTPLLGRSAFFLGASLLLGHVSLAGGALLFGETASLFGTLCYLALFGDALLLSAAGLVGQALFFGETVFLLLAALLLGDLLFADEAFLLREAAIFFGTLCCLTFRDNALFFRATLLFGDTLFFGGALFLCEARGVFLGAGLVLCGLALDSLAVRALQHLGFFRCQPFCVFHLFACGFGFFPLGFLGLALGLGGFEFLRLVLAFGFFPLNASGKLLSDSVRCLVGRCDWACNGKRKAHDHGRERGTPSDCHGTWTREKG